MYVVVQTNDQVQLAQSGSHMEKHDVMHIMVYTKKNSLGKIVIHSQFRIAQMMFFVTFFFSSVADISFVFSIRDQFLFVYF